MEDEPYLARIVEESLESRGFVVHWARDGREAIKLFEESGPDICVLDIMLPVKDGWQLAKEIKAISPHIPIIFLTAKTQTEDLVRGFESGGNDYIRKPFSMEELIVRIKNLLDISTLGKGNTMSINNKDHLEIGTYRFYPERYELHFGDRIQKLSHRENQLLKMLTKNTGKTIQRAQILKEIWGDDSFYNSRNLDVYISKIRDYLKNDPLVKLQTIKGVGYYFKLPSTNDTDRSLPEC